MNLTRRRLSEDWEDECRFLFPESTSPYYGCVGFKVASGPYAHVVDSPLGEDRDDRAPLRLEVVHGETLGGTPFTLMDAVEVHWQGWHGPKGGNTMDFVARMLVWKAHVDSTDDLRLTRGGFRIQGLLEFLTGGIVEQGVVTIKAERDAFESLEVKLDAGVLGLVVAANERMGRRKTSAELSAGGRFLFEKPISLEDYDRYYGQPLRDLVLFATNEPTWTDSSSIADLTDISSANEELGAERELFRLPTFEPTPLGSNSYYALLLNLAEVEEPAHLVSRWFELRRELGPVWALYFETLGRSTLPLENQLLNLTAFAEGYHRTLHDEPPLTDVDHEAGVEAILATRSSEEEKRVYGRALTYANSQSQRERLRWLTERALSVLGGWDLHVSRFVSEIVDTRNWLTHWGDRGKRVVEGRELHQALRRLELVIRTNLMLELGLDPDMVATQLASGLRLRGLP